MNEIEHKLVSVTYQLLIEKDGGDAIVEEMTKEKPFLFISGFDTTLEDFEKQLLTYKKGDLFDFIVSKDKAYGDYEEGRVVYLDKSIFSINNHFDHEHIYKGAVVPLQNEDGNHFLGHVLDITDDKVKMDLNHPLAGKDLNFRGEVLELRDATDEEVTGFINQMEHHCGCGCEDCEDGCGSHDHDDAGCGHCGCGHHH